MKERPILFRAPMVRAILDGSKTQTRRPVKPRKDLSVGCILAAHELAGEINRGDYSNCPYGQPGDRLWVRETFMQESQFEPCAVRYRATDEPFVFGPPIGNIPKNWRPSIHMPRWASRINLEITGVRVERLQNCSEADARAEGVTIVNRHMNGYCAGQFFPPAIRAYQELWEQINRPGSWDANPWVWVIEFRRLR